MPNIHTDTMKTTKSTKAKSIKATKPKAKRAAASAPAIKAKVRAKAKFKARPAPAKAVKASAPKPAAVAAPVRAPRITAEQIASRAYFIWEQHGRPSGREGEHWQMAEQQLKAA